MAIPEDGRGKRRRFFPRSMADLPLLVVHTPRDSRVCDGQEVKNRDSGYVSNLQRP